MSETAARSKFTCPACGGEAVWSAAKQKILCAFCGTESPATIEADGQIVEHDLTKALREVPLSDRGWRAERRQIKCQSCQAVSVFSSERQSQSCEFCGSTALVPFDSGSEVIRPESVLPFKVSEVQAREKIRAWYGSLWWAPNALKKRALTDTVKGLYLPYWTFDAMVDAQWSAEAGYYYTTTEYYRDNNGEERTRQVQQTRWQPAYGNFNTFYDDELVCASKGVHPELLRAVEPFPTLNDLRPYDPAYLSGWTVERYQLDLIGAAQRSRDLMQQKTTANCAGQVPGDTYRNLQVESRYSRQTFKHVLAPVWLLTYTYGAKSFQVVMNGTTGKLEGEHPKSWVKITLAVLAVIIVALIIFSAGGRRH